MIRSLAIFLIAAGCAIADEPKPEPKPTVEQLQAELAAVKQRLALEQSRCTALAQYYQFDAQIRQMDAAPKPPTVDKPEAK